MYCLFTVLLQRLVEHFPDTDDLTVPCLAERSSGSGAAESPHRSVTFHIPLRSPPGLFRNVFSVISLERHFGPSGPPKRTSYLFGWVRGHVSMEKGAGMAGREWRPQCVGDGTEPCPLCRVHRGPLCAAFIKTSPASQEKDWDSEVD